MQALLCLSCFGLDASAVLPEPGAFPNLQELTIGRKGADWSSDYKFGGPGAPWLAQLARLPRLRSAVLHHCGTASSKHPPSPQGAASAGEGAAGLEFPSHPALEHLEVQGAPVAVPLAGLPALQTLKVQGGGRVSGPARRLTRLELDSDSTAAWDLSAMPALESARLEFMELTPGQEGVRGLACATRLRRLELVCTSEAALGVWAAVGSLPQLEVLSLALEPQPGSRGRWAEEGDEGAPDAAMLNGLCQPSLRELELSFNGYRRMLRLSVAGGPLLPQLTRLRVSTVGAFCLDAEMPGLRRLEAEDVGEVCLGGSQGPHLWLPQLSQLTMGPGQDWGPSLEAAFERMPRLAELVARELASITATGLEAARELTSMSIDVGTDEDARTGGAALLAAAPPALRRLRLTGYVDWEAEATARQYYYGYEEEEKPSRGSWLSGLARLSQLTALDFNVEEVDIVSRLGKLRSLQELTLGGKGWAGSWAPTHSGTFDVGSLTLRQLDVLSSHRSLRVLRVRLPRGKGRASAARCLKVRLAQVGQGFVLLGWVGSEAC